MEDLGFSLVTEFGLANRRVTLVLRRGRLSVVKRGECGNSGAASCDAFELRGPASNCECQKACVQAFATLAGVAPIPANSGQVTTRYRLNRYGDRQLNIALHTVVRVRIQDQQATRDYVARRTADVKTSREIKHCHARYVARDLYRLLENGSTAA